MKKGSKSQKTTKIEGSIKDKGRLSLEQIKALKKPDKKKK